MICLVGQGWASVFFRGDREFSRLGGGRGSLDGGVGEKSLSADLETESWKSNTTR